jgi:DNA-binding XRE family transcriptional regulator
MMKKNIEFSGYVPPLGIDITTLGGQLYIYRYPYVFTQKDLALELKIDRSAVTQIENNNKVEKQYKRKTQTLLNL